MRSSHDLDLSSYYQQAQPAEDTDRLVVTSDATMVLNDHVDHLRVRTVLRRTPVIGLVVAVVSLIALWTAGELATTVLAGGRSRTPPVRHATTCPLPEDHAPYAVDYPHGAVASDHGVCSDVGVRVLRDLGGNAVDAAVAVALCLGVVNPASSGLGGGGFLLLHLHRNVTEVVDCRETAPGAADWNLFEGLPASASLIGGLAVAVPGELRGLETAHQRHGKLQWQTLVRPSALLAEHGNPVSRTLAEEIQNSKLKILSNEGLLNMLTLDNDNTTLLRHGDMLKLPALGRTLRAVMEEGADALYVGARARSMAEEIQAAGGILTQEDVETYRPVVRRPLIAKDVHGFTLVGAPPPSSGGATVLGAARFLANYAGAPFATLADSLSRHRTVEALKHVFAVRMSLSDPAFYTNVTEAAVEDLVTGNYVDRLREDYTSDDAVQPVSRYGGARWAQLRDEDVEEGEEGTGETNETHNYGRRERRTREFSYLEDHGTTHFSVVDKDRNAVSMTSTINYHFGSGLVSPSTGIIFNNEMDDFSSPGKTNGFGLVPSVSNYIAPYKRPLSSMSPMLIFRSPPQSSSSDDNSTSVGLGSLFMVLGASGGPKIISATLQTFLNHGFLGMSLFESVSRPRLHNQLLYKGSTTTLFDQVTSLLPYDNGDDVDHHDDYTIEVSNRTKGALLRRGQTLTPTDYTGTVQVVAVDPEGGSLTAVSDVRKNGSPAGY